MQIIDEITEFMKPVMKINDRIIYLTDIYVNIEKRTVRTKNKRKYIEKEKRNSILKNEIWGKNAGESNEKYFMSEVAKKINLHEKETFEIEKIILKKELGCSIYKL